MDIIKFSAEIEDGFFSDLVIQIQKDYMLCGIDFPEKIDTKKELLNVLFQSITKLNKENVKDLMNLLYRIDIKEVQIAHLAKKMNLSLEEAIVVSVLQRELQKIRLRKKSHI